MTENTLLKDLQTLGFTKNLAEVYLALFELGEGKAGEIVKKTGMHRHLVYVALTELERKKLISRTIERGVMRFHPLNPDFLLSEVQRKEELASMIIGELKGRRDWQSQQVIVYESKEEIKKVEQKYYDMARPGEEHYLLGLADGWFDLFDESEKQALANIQKKKGFHIKGISNVESHNDLAYKKLAPDLTEFKYISNVGSKDTEITILRDRIFIKIFVKPYTGIEIINERLASDYKKHFDFLWNQEVRTYVGWNDVEKLFTEELVADLKTGDKEYVIGAGYGESEHNAQFDAMFLKHNKWLIDHGVEKHALFYEKHRARFTNEITTLGDPLFKMVHIRYLLDAFYSPVEIHVFDSKCAITYFGETPISTLYTNAGVVNGFKKQFDMLWNMATE